MKISFLIPVYNVEKYIRNCLNSLYSQINDACEVILVDDGSTDLSGNICDEYKLKYPTQTQVFHNTNQGAYSTRNFALSQARGEYVWFIDPDDYIANGIVAKLFDNVHFRNNDVDILTMAYQQFNTKEVLNVFNSHDGMPIISGRDYLLSNNFNPYLWCNLYRREFLIENKLIFDNRLYSQGDWIFNLIAYIHAKRMQLTNFLGYHYFIGNPTSTLRSHDKVHRVRNANNSLLVITEAQNLLNTIEDPNIYQVVKNKRDSSACGFIYSLYLCNFPVYDLKKYLSQLSELGVYPIQSKLKKKKANLFRLFLNQKGLLLLVCKIRNLIYPQYTISKLL